jgi:hypothetical protein
MQLGVIYKKIVELLVIYLSVCARAYIILATGINFCHSCTQKQRARSSITKNFSLLPWITLDRSKWSERKREGGEIGQERGEEIDR